jgi:hypothetical protein
MNCKIKIKETSHEVAFRDVDTFGIDFEKLGDLLLQYTEEASDALLQNIEDEFGNIAWKWEIDISYAQNCIKFIKRYHKTDDVLFDDTTAQDVINLIQSWIESNVKNKKRLRYPSTLEIVWS